MDRLDIEVNTMREDFLGDSQISTGDVSGDTVPQCHIPGGLAKVGSRPRAGPEAYENWAGDPPKKSTVDHG